MKSIHTFAAIFFLIITGAFIAPSPAVAGGGGRAVITISSSGVAGGKGAEIVATIYRDNDYKLSTDEFGLFRIANAQPGQNCITKNQRSNGEGKIYGTCSSPTAGDMRVYIHFPDKVEDAQAYTVTILPKGSSTYVAPTSTGSYGPCASGLTSYGWDPANGKSCPQDHYDSWTAFCGNGYQQDVKIGNCLHANELSNHTEWKEVGLSICNNPRCDIPKPKVPVVTMKPSPKPSVTSTPIPEASSTLVAASPSAMPEPLETPAQLSFVEKIQRSFAVLFLQIKMIWSEK